MGAGCVLILGIAITAASVVALVLAILRPPGPNPGSRDMVGLTLAAMTGVLWMLTAWVWWRRRPALALVGTIVALVLGGVAAWLIRGR